MNNETAKESINRCLQELETISHIIEGMGATANVVPYLTRYSIIKACGTVEFCYKTVISDFHIGRSVQIDNFINCQIRESSANPSLDNIYKMLKMFDEDWKKDLKQKINNHANSSRIKSSLTSLNEARNSFAHGGNPSSTFEDIKGYFNDAIIILEMLDEVVCD